MGKAIDAVSESYRKKFKDKEHTVYDMSELKEGPVEGLPTGISSLDHAIGIGGVPKGGITELYGAESAGKTTVSLILAKNAQKEGKAVFYVDSEQTLNLEYAKKMGVKIDNEYFVLSHATNLERVFDMMANYIRTNEVGLVIIDSLAALVPSRELDEKRDPEAQTMGLKANLISSKISVISEAARQFNVPVVFVNQIRKNLAASTYGGNPNVTPGGQAIKYFVSLRLEMKSIGKVTARDVAVGNKVKFVVTKNKLGGMPFAQVETQLMFGKGFDAVADLIDTALATGVFVQAGSYIRYGDNNVAQGKMRAIDVLNDNPDLLEEVKQKVLTSNE